MATTNKKKILVFIPEFPGLTETFIEREVSKLAEIPSLQVEVLSLEKGKGALSDNLIEKTSYYRLDPITLVFGFKYFFLYPKRVLKAFLAILFNPNRLFKDTIYLFIKSLGYATIVEKYNIDLIYAHFMSESSTICLVISIVLNKELAISAHAKDVLQENGPADENVELIESKVKYAKFIAVCNEHAYKKLIKKCGIRYPKNIYLKYHGLDEKDLKEKLKKSPKLIDVPKKPILFSIGRFVEKKGFIYLIEATNILKEKNIDFKLYIAGAPGPLYAGVQDLITVLDLDDYIEIVGNGRGLSFEDILSYYRVSNVFVLPSINVGEADADGIPNVLIESALLNIPVVTTDAGSIEEFMTDKEAMIVNQKDSKDLAKALEKIMSDERKRETLTTNAHKKAIEMFNSDTNIKEIEKLILS
jgi:glycosyltransferase involved in cell wall biosynthesis